jgi:cell division protein FtsA
MSHIITGLDFGSSSVKGVVAQIRKDGSLSVITAFRHPAGGFRRGTLVDTEEAAAVMHELTKELQGISRAATKNVYLNFSSEQVKTRPSRSIVAVARSDQEIQQEDVDRALESSRAFKLPPNHIVIHNITREFFVDDVGDIQDPVGMTGNRLEASTLIVEGFAPQFNSLTRQAEKVGLSVSGVIFNPLAAAKSVLSKRQRDLGAVLVDFGADTTTFAVYEENKLVHAKCLPLGASYITKDLAVGLKVSYDLAEQLKLDLGSAETGEVNRRENIRLSAFDPDNRQEISKRFMCEIIEVRLAEILELIHNELKAVGRPLQLPGGVVMVGGGAKLRGVSEAVRHHLKLPVQLGIPDTALFEAMNPAHHNLIQDPEFAVASGLVLWGLTEEDTRPVSSPFDALTNIFKNLAP